MIAIPFYMAILSDSLSDIGMDIIIPTIFSSFILFNSYLYEISIAALVIPYAAVIGLLLWQFGVLTPAIQRVKRLASEMQSSAADKRDALIHTKYSQSKRTQRRQLTPQGYLHFLYKKALDVMTVVFYYCTIKAWKEILRRKPNRLDRIWQQQNMPYGLHGRVFVESHDSVLTSVINKSIYIPSPTNVTKTTMKEEAVRRYAARQNSALDIPEAIKAIACDEWSKDWQRGDDESHTTFVTQMLSRSLQAYTEEAARKEPLPINNPTYIAVSQKRSRDFNQANEYRSSFQIVTTVNQALKRMIFTHIKSSLSSLADGEYLASVLLSDGFDSPILIHDLLIMIHEAYLSYHPNNVPLSDEEQGEVVQDFYAWLVTRGASKLVEFNEFAAWFRRVDDKIMRVRQAIIDQPRARVCDSLASEIEEEEEEDRQSSTMMEDFNSSDEAAAKLNVFFSADEYDAQSYAVQFEDDDEEMDEEERLRRQLAAEESVYGFEFYENN
eukprot:gene33141-40894_t